MERRPDDARTAVNCIAGAMCAFLLCLASACTDAPVGNQPATARPSNKTAPIKIKRGKAVPPRQGLVVKRYVASVLRTAGSVPCSISLNSEMIHCTERLNWPNELKGYYRPTIYHYGGANTAGYQIGGIPECKIEACIHLSTVENLTSTYDLALFVKGGAWAMDVIYFDTTLLAYRFFEFRSDMHTVIAHCYIVDPAYQNRAGKDICKKAS